MCWIGESVPDFFSGEGGESRRVLDWQAFLIFGGKVFAFGACVEWSLQRSIGGVGRKH